MASGLEPAAAARWAASKITSRRHGRSGNLRRIYGAPSRSALWCAAVEVRHADASDHHGHRVHCSGRDRVRRISLRLPALQELARCPALETRSGSESLPGEETSRSVSGHRTYGRGPRPQGLHAPRCAPTGIWGIGQGAPGPLRNLIMPVLCNRALLCAGARSASSRDDARFKRSSFAPAFGWSEGANR